jgi:hypothetical protein
MLGMLLSVDKGIHFMPSTMAPNTALFLIITFTSIVVIYTLSFLWKNLVDKEEEDPDIYDVYLGDIAEMYDSKVTIFLVSALDLSVCAAGTLVSHYKNTDKKLMCYGIEKTEMEDIAELSNKYRVPITVVRHGTSIEVR